MTDAHDPAALLTWIARPLGRRVAPRVMVVVAHPDDETALCGARLGACVRRRARTVPARTPAHCAQAQFHCGKPPPAAVTLMRSARQVVFRPLPLDENVPLADVDGAPLGMRVRAVAAPGKAALHLDGAVPRTPEENVGFVLRADAGAIGYFPSVAGPSPAVAAALQGCRAVIFDGTFYRDDEMTARGLGARDARAMAHWPLGGPDGSLGFLAGLAPRRRLLTHVSNTNPILVEDSLERRAVEAHGVEVGHDGVEVLA